jgi:regulatory protein
MANHELSKAEWLDKCEAFCARAEHCAADVRRKLYEWGAPEHLPDENGRIVSLWQEIENSLYKNGFLDDARFCAAYVHDKVEYQSWGRVKIQASLHALQLPESEICNAIKNIDESVYFDNLRKLACTRKTDPEDKRIRFLLQRGFTYEEIKSNVRSI